MCPGKQGQCEHNRQRSHLIAIRFRFHALWGVGEGLGSRSRSANSGVVVFVFMCTCPNQSMANCLLSHSRVSIFESNAEGGGRTCVLSMSWGHARGQDNARTVLITIGRILTGHIPTKLRKRLGQGFIPFLDDLFLSNRIAQWRMQCTAWTPRQYER